MIKEAFVGKGAAVVGASVVFCGLTLYGAGLLLDYLFRDVDPKRVETEAEDDMDVIETEEPVADPT